ncbi:hypothetical protein C0Q70_12557 [Pomacea canaliculata]|uniref:K Homology domain-containing protein n=1 Tax=Pomacea canaliculata TaxID=400727 RepID=A0A2T7P1V0_POMCA|nr:hypothetical protein C0Q70_12557 [Pomacea canaliculata]
MTADVYKTLIARYRPDDYFTTFPKPRFQLFCDKLQSLIPACTCGPPAAARGRLTRIGTCTSSQSPSGTRRQWCGRWPKANEFHADVEEYDKETAHTPRDPSVTFLYHEGEGHTGEHPGSCFGCGMEIAEALRRLGLGTISTSDLPLSDSMNMDTPVVAASLISDAMMSQSFTTTWLPTHPAVHRQPPPPQLASLTMSKGEVGKRKRRTPIEECLHAVPDHLCGLVIGKDGHTIREIKTISGASVYKQHSPPQYPACLFLPSVGLELRLWRPSASFVRSLAQRLRLVEYSLETGPELAKAFDDMKGKEDGDLHIIADEAGPDDR